MTNIFELIAKQHEEIVKEAALPAVIGGAFRLGKQLWGGLSAGTRAGLGRVATVGGAALTASDLASGTKRFSNVSAANRAKPFQPPLVG